MDVDSALNTNTDGHRRNGKPASCEPCRKAKVRCDHTRPTCNRCRRRGAIARCWYHPAPLTRDHTTTDQHNSPISSALLPSTGASLSTTASSDDCVVSKERHAKAARPIEKLVAHLEEASLIDELIQKYYTPTELRSPLVPACFLLPAMSDLRARYESSVDRKALIRGISSGLVTLAQVPIVLDKQTSPSAFMSQYREDSLRIETLGTIYTIAARAVFFGCVPLQDNKAAFVQKMYYCSNKALSWARKHLPQITDTLIWLACENLLLTTQVTGDTSLASWRCLGTLVSDVLALDMHRESSYAALPFFLAEIRRRSLAFSYNVDKFLAPLVGRIQRLPKRYIDCRLPLDLVNDDLLSETPLSQDQLSFLLTEDGWSREYRHSCVAHTRVRYLLSTFREEVMDFDVQAQTPDTLESLRSLLSRSQQMWNSLPLHLYYAADCWSSGMSTFRCCLLITTYLSYRDLSLHVYQLLAKSDSSFHSSILEVSNDILHTVLQLGAVRSRASFLTYDFAYLVVAHGIPCALQLAGALAGQNSLSGLPSGLSRSALIRSLSVFVASLESLHDLSEMDKATSEKAAETISQILDSVLSPAALSSIEDLGLPISTQMSEMGMQADYSNNGFLTDGAAWLDDIEWTNFSSDWVKF